VLKIWRTLRTMGSSGQCRRLASRNDSVVADYLYSRCAKSESDEGEMSKQAEARYYEWNKSQALAHRPMNSSFFLCCVSGESRPSPNGPIRGA
jgi:hypothetical protein